MDGYFYAFAMCCQRTEASSQRNALTIFALNLTATTAGAFLVLSHTLYIEHIYICMHVYMHLSNTRMELYVCNGRSYSGCIPNMLF